MEKFFSKKISTSLPILTTQNQQSSETLKKQHTLHPHLLLSSSNPHSQRNAHICDVLSADIVFCAHAENIHVCVKYIGLLHAF